MASPKRQSDTSLKDRLFKEFYHFSFFKAVHLLESLFPDKKPLGRTLTPSEEGVRFSVKPGFKFPPSDIAGLKHTDPEKPVDMEIAFMGLIGPSGLLPNWYNELALQRARRKDFTFIDFLNLFHHRLISLFYLAWKKHRLPENYLPGANDRFSKYLLSLIGLGTGGLTEKIGFEHESLLFYSGLLSNTIPSATAIEATVAYFSGVTTRIDQFVERMLPLSIEDQTQLGSANSQLGIDTVCGSYVWESQSKFRINLGPMRFKKFLRFLPTGDLLHPIFSLVRYITGIEYEFEIRVFLKREEVPPCILGEKTPASPRLGWSTWVKSREITHKEDPYITFQKEQ